MYYKRYLKNKPTAVSLSYEKSKEGAPKVTAVGKGELAQQIINLAKENDIQIYQDEDLVNVLSLLEINSYIPIEVYGVVAEILCYIYEQKKPKSDEPNRDRSN